MLPAQRRALLFDIDGTLADTDALHVEAFNQVFGPRGHVFDRARAVSQESAATIAAEAQNFGQQDDITVVTVQFAGIPCEDASERMPHPGSARVEESHVPNTL